MAAAELACTLQIMVCCENALSRVTVAVSGTKLKVHGVGSLEFTCPFWKVELVRFPFLSEVGAEYCRRLHPSYCY